MYNQLTKWLSCYATCLQISNDRHEQGFIKKGKNMEIYGKVMLKYINP